MKGYHLEIHNDVLMLKSSTYKAEEGSVLHSGIFNKEFTSSLAAGAMTMTVAILMYLAKMTVNIIYVVIAVIVFMSSFVFFRMLVFFDTYLLVTFDRLRENVNVMEKKILRSRHSYSIKDIEDIRIDYVVFSPENPDGIAFVEKIAAQHGTVIPGLGEEKRFHSVKMVFRNGDEISVFSSDESAEAETLAGEIKSFLGLQNA